MPSRASSRSPRAAALSLGACALAIAFPAAAASAPERPTPSLPPVAGEGASETARASAPRIVRAFGAVAGPGTITFVTVRYCDANKRPASFRHLIRVFDRSGREVGRKRTRLSNTSLRCVELSGIQVRTGRAVGARVSVRVTNLRTGRSAVRRGAPVVGT